MSYIHLPLFLSCLILTQSVYSMEPKELPKKHRKSTELIKNQHKKKTRGPSTRSLSSSSHSGSPIVTPTESPIKQEREIPKLTIMTSDNSRQQDFITQQLTSPKTQQSNNSNTQQPTSPRNLITQQPANPKTPKKQFPRALSVELLSPRGKLAKNQPSAFTTDSITTKKQSSISPISLAQSDSKIITSSRSSQTKISLIEAVRSKDIASIQNIMSNPHCDVNEQTKFGMTALHLAVVQLMNSQNTPEFPPAKNMVFLLLSEPYIDSSKENNEFKTASQLIQGIDHLPEIRQPLFARLTLDLTVWLETFFMLMNAQINKQEINQLCIAETTKRIFTKIRNTQSKQGGEEIPINALQLFFADDTFIGQMIKLRMQQMQQKSTEYLISVLNKEIQPFLFNTEITEDIIIKIRENIKKIIKKQSKKSKSYSLPGWATDKFLYTIINSYLKEEKEKFNKFIEKEIPLQPKSNSKEKIFLLPSNSNIKK